MLKYIDTKVVFQEIPKEITLAINISGCPVKCPDCHSKYLWEDIGESLTEDSLSALINNNKGISCVAFMGGDADVEYLYKLFSFVKQEYPDIKVAWYSGVQREVKNMNLSDIDYIKIGPYIKNKGPLDSPLTNQKMYKVHKHKGSVLLMDITKSFIRNRL